MDSNSQQPLTHADQRGNLTLEAQLASIDALGASTQQQKRDHFKQLYPSIERALERGTPAKTLLAHLRTIGLQLSINTFHKMLDHERGELAAEGLRIRCEHCGSMYEASTIGAGCVDEGRSDKGAASAETSSCTEQADSGGAMCAISEIS